MRIYLASSWRNAEAVLIIADCLKRHGFEVDCFCDQVGGRFGFNIAEYLQKVGQDVNEVDAITALSHPAVEREFKLAFAEDKKWLDWCDCVIMLMPCGRSSHLEAGYAKGQEKLFYIYWLTKLAKGEFDSMYQFADGMFRTDELYKLIRAIKDKEQTNIKVG